MNTITKQQAIDAILDALTWGESVPAVFGGNGGSGFEFVSPAQNKDDLAASLSDAEFRDNMKPAPDFRGNVDFSDYTACVQFSYNAGSWVQFLLCVRE